MESARASLAVENKSSDVGNVKADSTYGTKRASAYRIMEDTLNLRDTRIFDYVYDEHNNKKAVLNHKETTAAQAKQEVIKQAFQDWIWKDPERRNRLVRYYNDTFNSIRPREYDGSHITFGGISPEIQLRPHQVNAIAHILYGGNTLLAHKVGAGKTFEMVAAAQESKRLGLCQKSMFVVPNHLVGQWACLRRRGFLMVQHRFFIVVFVINIVKDAGVTEIQGVLHDAVCARPLRAVSAVRLDIPNVGAGKQAARLMPEIHVCRAEPPCRAVGVRVFTALPICQHPCHDQAGF